MEKPVKALIECGPEKMEHNCDLFASIMLTDIGDGFGCDFLIVGTMNTTGMIQAIRALKQLEDQLYKMLPLPRELSEAIVKSSKGTDNDRRKARPDSATSDAITKVLVSKLVELGTSNSD